MADDSSNEPGSSEKGNEISNDDFKLLEPAQRFEYLTTRGVLKANGAHIKAYDAHLIVGAINGDTKCLRELFNIRFEKFMSKCFRSMILRDGLFINVPPSYLVYLPWRIELDPFGRTPRENDYTYAVNDFIACVKMEIIAGLKNFRGDCSFTTHAWNIGKRRYFYPEIGEIRRDLLKNFNESSFQMQRIGDQSKPDLLENLNSTEADNNEDAIEFEDYDNIEQENENEIQPNSRAKEDDSQPDIWIKSLINIEDWEYKQKLWRDALEHVKEDYENKSADARRVIQYVYYENISEHHRRSNNEIIEKTGFSSRYITETIASFEQALMRKLVELDKNRFEKIKTSTLDFTSFKNAVKYYDLSIKRYLSPVQRVLPTIKEKMEKRVRNKNMSWKELKVIHWYLKKTNNLINGIQDKFNVEDEMEKDAEQPNGNLFEIKQLRAINIDFIRSCIENFNTEVSKAVKKLEDER